jgi:hypothetical protein
VTGLPERLLMCTDHWRLVPARLRGPIWDAYDHGRGLNPHTRLPSPALAAAQTDAIVHVNSRIGAPPPGQYGNPITDTH